MTTASTDPGLRGGDTKGIEPGEGSDLGIGGSDIGIQMCFSLAS